MRTQQNFCAHRLQKIRGNTVHDPLKIANYFNIHFPDVSNKLVKSLPPKKKPFSEYLTLEGRDASIDAFFTFARL